jgi:small subunit ribosomal protein S4
MTGANLLTILECRFDNVVYRMGMAESRAEARQLVLHNHFRINGKKVDIASYNVVPGDEIEVRAKPGSRQIAVRNLEENRLRTPPPWLTLNAEALKATIVRLPTREEMDPGINEQLIVEFYSR